MTYMTKGGQYLVADGIISLCKTFVSKRVATLIFSLYLYGSYTTSRRIPSTVAVDSKSIYKTCHCAHHISVTDSILRQYPTNEPVMSCLCTTVHTVIIVVISSYLYKI